MLLTLAPICMLGAMSPGPDFAIVVKNTLSGKLKSGIMTSFGIIFALLVHLTYIIFGLSLITNDIPIIFTLIQYVGAAYLFYLGISSFKKSSSPSKEKPNLISSPFLSGFLCNLLNPKAMLFITALFTQTIGSEMNYLNIIYFIAIIVVTTLSWFISLSYLLSRGSSKNFLDRHQRKFSLFMGFFLCALAIKILF